MHDFTVLVLSGAFASSVALTLDMLSAAASLAATAACATPRWRVVTTQGAIKLGHGMTIDATILPKTARPDGSTWIIPGLGLESPPAIKERLAQPDALRAVQALQAHVQAGGTVAASCSAVFLLQSAGLLAGRRVSTSWWLAPLLQQLEPRCVVDADRMVIRD